MLVIYGFGWGFDVSTSPLRKYLYMRSTDVTHKETKGKEPPLPAKAIRLEDRVAPDDGLKTSCSTLFKPIGLISHYHENCHYRTGKI